MILIQRARVQQPMIIIDGDKWERCELYLPTYFPAQKTNQNKTSQKCGAAAKIKKEIISEYSKSLENTNAVLIHK